MKYGFGLSTVFIDGNPINIVTEILPSIFIPRGGEGLEGIQFPEPTLHIPPTLTTGLALICVVNWIYRQFREIHLWLKVVAVREGENNFWVTYDKSDLSGYKLRLLYIFNNNVKRCWFQLTPGGPLVYGLISYSGPYDMNTKVSDTTVNQIVQLVRTPMAVWEVQYFSFIALPGPNQRYWEVLTSIITIKINNKQNRGPNLWVYPCVDIEEEFTIGLNIYKEDLYGTHMRFLIYWV